jgi:MFS family permease
MNCVNHSDRQAVGKCEGCGAGLCEECYSYFNPHLCYECATKLANEDRRTFHKALAIGIISGVLGLTLAIILWVANKGMGPGMGIFFCLWFPMAGIAFGLSIAANGHKKQNFWTWVGAFLFSFIIAPVSFIVYLVRTIKWAKVVKNDQQLLANYLQETPETVAASAEEAVSEVREPQAVAPISTSAGPFHQLFDQDYRGDIVFENGENQSLTFVQGGVIHLEGKVFAILQPKPLPEGMGENEALAYEITVDKDDLENSEMTIVSDEALNDRVFAFLHHSLEEGEASKESLVGGTSLSEHRVKWWIYLILGLAPLLGWGMFLYMYFTQKGSGASMNWLFFSTAGAVSGAYVMALGLLPKRLGDIARWRRIVFPILGILLMVILIVVYYLVGFGNQSMNWNPKDPLWNTLVALGGTYGPYLLYLVGLFFLHKKDHGSVASVVWFFILFFIGGIIGVVAGIILAVALLIALFVLMLKGAGATADAMSYHDDSGKSYTIDGKEVEKIDHHKYKDKSGQVYEETGNFDEVEKVDH